MTLILIGVTHEECMRYAAPGLGRLLAPRRCLKVRETLDAGLPVACDNDFYARPDPRRFREMLDEVEGLPVRFVAVPDAVADHERTMNLWARWLAEIKDRGLPAAFVLQDGCEPADVPWDEADALFVGGSTEFKMGEAAAASVVEAKRRGLWVHMGRASSRRRFDYARALGCDSVDGYRFTRYRDRDLRDALDWHRQPLQERMAL